MAYIETVALKYYYFSGVLSEFYWTNLSVFSFIFALCSFAPFISLQEYKRSFFS